MLDRRTSGAGIVSDYEPIPKEEFSKDRQNGKAKRDSLFLYFASFTGSLSMFGAGECLIWSSPVIPKLQSNITDINPLGTPVTSSEITLLVGLFAMGLVIAVPFCGIFVDGIGRKNTLLLLGVFNSVSLTILALSSSVMWMSVARTLSGISVGGILFTLPIFQSEITEGHNRGKFGCLMSLFLPLGELYGYVMGYFFSIKKFTLLCVIPTVVHLALFLIFVPETPVFLLYQGKKSRAIKSLEKYRNKDPDEIEKEISEMEFTLKETIETHSGDWKTLFSQQSTRRGFVIGLGMVLAQMGTGVFVLLSFMGPIFEEAQTGIPGNMTAIFVGCLKVLVFFFVVHIVEKLGRKPLMFYSSLFCSITLFFVGLYFFMKAHDLDSYRSYSWLPVVSMLLFIISYSFGLGPIPTASIGELFPTGVRSRAGASIMFFVTVFNSILIAVFPFMKECIGVCGCMWAFSASSALGAVFIYFMVPETKGRSFEDIQKILRGEKSESGRSGALSLRFS